MAFVQVIGMFDDRAALEGARSEVISAGLATAAAIQVLPEDPSDPAERAREKIEDLLERLGKTVPNESSAMRQAYADFIRRGGQLCYWGVSNFDTADMEELFALPGGSNCATNQVPYNLAHRGIEYDLAPRCRDRRIPIMAYSPIEQGRVLDDPEVQRIALRHHVTPAQVALAWVIRQEGVNAIPKAGSTAHVRENRGAAEVHLSKQDLKELDRAFPPPRRKMPLEMI